MLNLSRATQEQDGWRVAALAGPHCQSGQPVDLVTAGQHTWAGQQDRPRTGEQLGFGRRHGFVYQQQDLPVARVRRRRRQCRKACGSYVKSSPAAFSRSSSRGGSSSGYGA